MPMPCANPKIRRVHRLVILPDYQGIGLGTRFLDIVANMWNENGYDISIVTSAKNMIYGLRKNKNWKFMRYGHMGRFKEVSIINKSFIKTSSDNRNTASFIRERKR